jgi:hypothetical protein
MLGTSALSLASQGLYELTFGKLYQNYMKSIEWMASDPAYQAKYMKKTRTAKLALNGASVIASVVSVGLATGQVRGWEPIATYGFAVYTVGAVALAWWTNNWSDFFRDKITEAYFKVRFKSKSKGKKYTVKENLDICRQSLVYLLTPPK